MRRYQKIEKQKRDKHAQTYEEWFQVNKGFLFDLYERELFIQCVRENQPRSVIDIGSGTGRITRAIAPLVPWIVGTDFSFQSLQILHRRKTDNCFALCADSITLPIKDEYFDLAVSCQVLPQLQSEDLLMALKEVNRVLKPGCLFVFSAYNNYYWRYKRHIKEGETSGVYGKSFSEEYVHDLANKANFAVKKIEYYKSLPLRLFEHKKWIEIDRLICSAPYLGKRASAYLIAILKKEG